MSNFRNLRTISERMEDISSKSSTYTATLSSKSRQHKALNVNPSQEKLENPDEEITGVKTGKAAENALHSKCGLNYHTLCKVDMNDGKIFEDYYTYINILGTGAFGVVISAIKRDNGQMVAIKVITDIFIIYPLYIYIYIYRLYTRQE